MSKFGHGIYQHVNGQSRIEKWKSNTNWVTVFQSMQRLTAVSVTYVQGQTSVKTVWHGVQSFQQTLTPREKNSYFKKKSLFKPWLISRAVRHLSTPLTTVMYRTVSLSKPYTPKATWAQSIVTATRCEPGIRTKNLFWITRHHICINYQTFQLIINSSQRCNQVRSQVIISIGILSFIEARYKHITVDTCKHFQFN